MKKKTTQKKKDLNKFSKKNRRKIKNLFLNSLRSIKKRNTKKKIKQRNQDLIRKLYLKNFDYLNDYYKNFPNKYNNLMKCKTTRKIINNGNSKGYVIEQVCRN